jgi:cytochrome c oxidase assembly factor 5
LYIPHRTTTSADLDPPSGLLQGMANSCLGLREELLECIAESECIKSGKQLEECMQLKDEEGGCHTKRLLYMQCKRGQLDMRNRFKGNVPGQPRQQGGSTPEG